MELSEYDGVFYDTYGDEDVDSFGGHLPSLVKKVVLQHGGMVKLKPNSLGIEDVAYEHIDIVPPENNYYVKNVYYLPQKEY